MERDRPEAHRHADRHREVGESEDRGVLGEGPERPADPGHREQDERAADGDRAHLPGRHRHSARRGGPVHRHEHAGQAADER